jgi:hypothetical protein
MQINFMHFMGGEGRIFPSEEERCSIPAGYISTETYPVRPADRDFLARSEDQLVTVFLSHPDKLDGFFREASINRENYAGFMGRVYMPCAIGRRTHALKPYYKGNLIVPPNVSSRPELMAEDLIVPGMHVITSIQRDGVVKGYVLGSDHSDAQQYFTPSARQIDLLLNNSSDPEMQGVVIDVASGRRGHRPCVVIKNDSVRNPDVIEQNRDALKKLYDERQTFWWQIYF